MRTATGRFERQAGGRGTIAPAAGFGLDGKTVRVGPMVEGAAELPDSCDVTFGYTSGGGRVLVRWVRQGTALDEPGDELPANARKVELTGFRPGPKADFGLPGVAPTPTKNLGLADQVLAARIGASFAAVPKRSKPGRPPEFDFVFAGYAPDVAKGLAAGRPVDRNPYNFAAPHGDAPWEAEDPAGAMHEREREGRVSGRLTLTFTAATPIFVPSAEEPERFFSCWNAEKKENRPAIPGSSVKGVVRSLFEALTNSRHGVTDSLLCHPPLYRRRSGTLFVVQTMPTPTTPGTVEAAVFEYRDAAGNVVDKALDPPPTTREPWRANLYAVGVPYLAHRGGKEQIRYRLTGPTVDLYWETYETWLSMRDHPHLVKHRANVRARDANERTGYLNNDPPTYEQAVADGLFDLAPRSLIYGFATGGRIVSFGKNVNYLWPAASSPAKLLGRVGERPAGDGMLAGSDPAEATFGFIGDDGGAGGQAHPFRGRVRFTTFWAEGSPRELEPVRLMPLSSPTVSRAKARPLYLEPLNGRTPAWLPTETVRLRGRKFYWHQRAHQEADPNGDGIPLQHRQDELEKLAPNGPRVPPGVAAAPIRPLAAGTCFRGQVQFANLTKAELGALLVSLAPQLGFGAETGLKIGKGKPRGLGSVRTQVSQLRTLRDARERYATLDAELDRELDEKQMKDFVDAYKQWAAGQGKAASWDALEFVQDLRALLRIPAEPRVHVYPPSFRDYTWNPDFNDPDGDPKGKTRPAPMKRARDIP